MYLRRGTHADLRGGQFLSASNDQYFYMPYLPYTRNHSVSPAPHKTLQKFSTFRNRYALQSMGLQLSLLSDKSMLFLLMQKIYVSGTLSPETCNLQYNQASPAYEDLGRNAYQYQRSCAFPECFAFRSWRVWVAGFIWLLSLHWVLGSSQSSLGLITMKCTESREHNFG